MACSQRRLSKYTIVEGRPCLWKLWKRFGQVSTCQTLSPSFKPVSGLCLVRLSACALHDLLVLRSTHILCFGPSNVTFVPSVCTKTKIDCFLIKSTLQKIGPSRHLQGGIRSGAFFARCQRWFIQCILFLFFFFFRSGAPSRRQFNDQRHPVQHLFYKQGATKNAILWTS